MLKNIGYNDTIIKRNFMKYIITYQEQSKNICFNELKKLNANFKEVLALNECQSLIQLNLPENEFAQNVLLTPIIFIRHIMSINYEFEKPVNNNDILKNIFARLNPSKSFSIQFLCNIQRDNCKINIQELAKYIEEKSYILNVKKPQQIVSIFETSTNIYIGIGDEYQNLSTYKAGQPHFSKNFEFVSRAEYKLLEALNLCKIDLSNLKLGADLGSAPGGWTKVLASHNINTHSIDPASLAPDIKAMSNVKYFRMTTQEYLQKYDYDNFDIIVNDMKMDIFPSTQIIMDFYPRLAPNGYVVMTFKLAKNFKYNDIISCINTLKKKYTLLLARQLFHNRSEITVVLKK